MSGRIEPDLELLNHVTGVRFGDLLVICRRWFGQPRVRGSHHIFKMPWPGDPRVNIQKDGRMAKPYQVRVVRKALLRLVAEGFVNE